MVTHKDLDIWKIGIELVAEVYRATGEFPREEVYGITSQLRRAAVSIPSNIAEGAARTSRKEFLQYLYIALGSLAELETQVVISQRLRLLQEDIHAELIEKLRRKMLNFIKHLKKTANA